MEKKKAAMFAVVKYLQGPIRGKKQIISCKLIKNFDSKNYSNRIKYEVQYCKDKVCAANVIAVDGNFRKLLNNTHTHTYIILSKILDSF